MTKSIAIIDDYRNHRLISRALIDRIDVVLRDDGKIRFTINTVGEEVGETDIELCPINHPRYTLESLRKAAMLFARALIDNEPDEILQQAWDRVRDNVESDTIDDDTITLFP